MSRKVAIEKTRIGGSKVRTGCRTCKARRVKCDEGKPDCQRCIKAGRICERYASTPEPVAAPAGHKFVHYVEPKAESLSRRASAAPSPSARQLSVSRSPSPLSDLDSPSLRSLDFYINATALHLGQPFGIDVFSDALARLSHYDPAVRHCIIALSAFHENFLYPSGLFPDDQRRLLALDHYNKSIQAVVELNRATSETSTLTTLVTCLIYCAIESVQGHINSGMKHITAGIRLLAEQEDRLLRQEQCGRGVSTGFVDSIRRLFINLGTQAMGIEDAGIDRVVVAYLQTQEEHAVMEYDFSTTEQALADLSTIINDVIRLVSWAETCHKDADFPNQNLLRAGHKMDMRFASWTSAYHRFLTDLGGVAASTNHATHSALLILRINQIVIRIILQWRFAKEQVEFDKSVADFMAIVNLAEEFLELQARQQRASSTRSNSPSPEQGNNNVSPTFTLTLGIIPALFFTCAKCRHQATRRRALRILQTCRRRESVWDANVVGIVAQHVIELEETSAVEYWQEQAGFLQGQGGTDVDISSPEGIPEEARVGALQIDFLGGEDSAKISFIEQVRSSRHELFLLWDAENQQGYFVPNGVYRDPPPNPGQYFMR